MVFTFGAWRSLVARLLWEQDVGSSNLSAPTIFQCLHFIHMPVIYASVHLNEKSLHPENHHE